MDNTQTFNIEREREPILDNGNLVPFFRLLSTGSQTFIPMPLSHFPKQPIYSHILGSVSAALLHS